MRAHDAHRREHEVVTCERITTDPAVMGGVPCVRGLRFPVAMVLTMLADGMGTEGILTRRPGLTAEDIRESFLYAAGLCANASCRSGSRREVPHRKCLSPLLADALKARSEE